MASPIIPRRNVSYSKASRQLSNSSPLQILLQMGIPKHRAEKALAATGGRSVQIAADWLLAHVNDATLDDNTPREYILYLCPSGPLLDQLQTFFSTSMKECGRNGAHNYLPHITLCSFFQAPDDSVPHLVNALKHVVEKLRSEIPDRIQLDHYTSPTFLGLFVAEEHNDSLKRLAVQFMREVSEYIVSEMGALDVLGTCFPWCSSSYSSLTKGISRKRIQVEPYLKALHITLSYQFPSEHYNCLEKLSREIDVNAASSWELKLFSRDSIIKGNEVFRVCHPYIPQQEPDELELIVGDFVYSNLDVAQASGKDGSATGTFSLTDGWAEGTSWLTGCAGFFPKEFVEKVAESDAWTLHKSVPLTGNISFEDFDEPALSGRRLPLSYFQQCASELSSKLISSCDSKEQKRAVSPVLPLEHKLTDINSLEPKARQLFIVRHAERVDFTFGNSWIGMCVNNEGKYVRKDLNMPREIQPRRGGTYQDYAQDSPLTRIGLYQATLTGEAMKEANVTFSQAFCSPSLRCIQTTTNILKAAGLAHLPIHIEPGLFEWLAWYQESKPCWLTPQEASLLGYNVAMNYKSVVSLEELRKGNETSENYYIRSFYVVQTILNQTFKEGSNILLVVHAASLDTCSRQLTGKEPRSANDLVRLTHKAPYCGVVVAEETAEKKWQLVKPPFPPLTHTGTSSIQFDWKCLLT